jgi:hypothetical protein
LAPGHPAHRSNCQTGKFNLLFYNSIQIADWKRSTASAVMVTWLILGFDNNDIGESI